MEFKKMISVVILSLYCSVSEASEVKVLNFVELYKTTLNDVEQYLKTNKCKYIVSKEIHKGYRKYRRVVVSECFKYPNEEVTFITLIYHNSLKEDIADEVRLVYSDKLNIFDIYQINLEKRYKNPSNQYIKNVDDRYYEWNTNDYMIVHANDNGLGLISFLGKPDSSIGDFNFEILTNKKILGFIELNKTSLSEVEEKLNELNCKYRLKKSSFLGIKRKTLDVEKCFFLPKIEDIIIDFVDYDPLRMNKVDEVVLYYSYDEKTHNLYIDQLNSKYGTPARKDEDQYEWEDENFYINLIKHKPFLNNNNINIVNVNFTTYEYKRLFLERLNYINSNHLNKN